MSAYVAELTLRRWGQFVLSEQGRAIFAKARTKTRIRHNKSLKCPLKSDDTTRSRAEIVSAKASKSPKIRPTPETKVLLVLAKTTLFKGLGPHHSNIIDLLLSPRDARGKMRESRQRPTYDSGYICIIDRAGVRKRRGTKFGGGGGIRTPGKLSLPTVFKTVAIDHSATPPRGKPDRLAKAM